jgi:hypothetical protein
MQLLWMERFGAVGAQLPYAIAEQGGNVYVSGTTSAQMATVPDSDSGLLCNASKCMFLLKLNASSGATIWGRAFGPGEMAMDPTSLIAADTTSLWLGGGWSSLIDFNMGSKSALGAQDLVLAKFAPLP